MANKSGFLATSEKLQLEGEFQVSIYERFKLHFPRIEAKVISHYMRGNFEVVVELEDGRMFSYYDLDRTLHRLPRVGEQWSDADYRIEFGRLLYQIMRVRGITEETLSKKTGISQHSISKYITGSVSPGFHNVVKIVKALGCSMDDLMY